MKKKTMALLMTTMMVTLLAGCGSSTEEAGTAENTETEAVSEEEAEESAEEETGEEEAGEVSEPIHVVVAGTPGYEPFTYVGEDGEETGFDIEVLRAIDEIAPEIECEFTYSEWDTLMPGLDAGKFDIICNQLGKSEEREEMYYFEELPISCSGGMVITNEKYKDGTGWESLEGAKVECLTGSSYAAHTEEWLSEHPGTFEIVYVDTNLAQILEDIVNGRADATLEDPAVARSKAEANGLENDIYVIENLYNPTTAYYMFAKTDKGAEIAAIVDKYLPVLYYDGTLSKLAEEYIGSDTVIKELPNNGYYTEATLEEFQEAHQ